MQKLLTFFSKKFQQICVSLDVNFNKSLTNNVVSFEQLGPDSVRHGTIIPRLDCPGAGLARTYYIRLINESLNEKWTFLDICE